MSLKHLSPFVEELGTKLIDTSAEHATARIIIRRDLCDRSGNAIGGVILAIADGLAAQFCEVNMVASASHPQPVDSSTNFLLPISEGEVVQFEVRPLFKEKDRIACETRVTCEDGRLVAVVCQTYLIASRVD